MPAKTPRSTRKTISAGFCWLIISGITSFLLLPATDTLAAKPVPLRDSALFERDRQTARPEERTAQLAEEAIRLFFPENLQMNHADEAENLLAYDSIVALLLNLDAGWHIIATELGFDDEFQLNLMQKNLKSPDDYLNQFKLVADFLSQAVKQYSLTALIEALEKEYDLMAHTVKFYQNKRKNELLSVHDDSPSPATASDYSSYIFLMWNKMPERETNWGHVIPNTELYPHQQTVYEWAYRNPEKYVVLWFDSQGLSETEHMQYIDFRTQLQSLQSNINVLDIRQVDWGEESFTYSSTWPFSNEGREQLLTLKLLGSDPPHKSFVEKNDFLKIRLLHQGSQAINSAIKNSGQTVDKAMPQRGIYFDLDYLPIRFDFSNVCSQSLCLDDSTQFVSSFKLTEQQMISSKPVMLISLLAVDQDKLDLIGPLLYTSLNRRADTLLGLISLINVIPRYISGTKEFRMRHLMYESGSGILTDIHGQHGQSWSPTSNDGESAAQTNKPLTVHESGGFLFEWHSIGRERY